MTQAGTRAADGRRNPGPDWGYGFLLACDRVLPEGLFRPLRAAGTMVALAFMPAQRRHSREYLALVLPARPTLRDVFRHFFACEEALMAKLRVANGLDIPCEFDPSASAAEAWFAGGGPILLGTFHVGASDMLGFQIGCHEKRRIHLVRRRVGNSGDTERLSAAGGGYVQFIWGNEASELVFGLKAAADSGDAIALQCDRIENARQTEEFEFLGARRSFPTTIYRLARVLGRPVDPHGRRPGARRPLAPLRGSPVRAGGRGGPGGVAGPGARALPGVPAEGGGAAARAAVPLVQLHPAKSGGRVGRGRRGGPMTTGTARAFYGACYYLSWFWFAVAALALNAACVPLC